METNCSEYSAIIESKIIRVSYIFFSIVSITAIVLNVLLLRLLYSLQTTSFYVRYTLMNTSISIILYHIVAHLHATVIFVQIITANNSCSLHMRASTCVIIRSCVIIFPICITISMFCLTCERLVATWYVKGGYYE